MNLTLYVKADCACGIHKFVAVNHDHLTAWLYYEAQDRLLDLGWTNEHGCVRCSQSKDLNRTPGT